MVPAVSGQQPQKGLCHVRTTLPRVLHRFDRKITLLIIWAISLIHEPRAAGTRCWGTVIKHGASGDAKPATPLVGLHQKDG